MRIPPLSPFAAILLAAAPPLEAQIYADVETNLGTFTIEIDFVNTPLAAANFIGLAEGTKAWLDSATGAVRTNTPYYDGIIFHRVIAGFMNQVGSQNGQGTDGPGYTFPDELATSDFTIPYQVAMANSGPQSNGSQIFVYVNNNRSDLNGIHTVFGTVPPDDGPDGIVDGSRAVCDAINAVPTTASRPDTDVVILSVTIRRIGAAAQAFDPAAQGLPTVSGFDVPITFNGAGNVPFIGISQSPGTTLHFGLSPDLATWSVEERYHDADSIVTLFGFPAGTFQATFDRHFYRAAMTTWPPDAFFPDTLKSRTLSMLTTFDATVPFIFTFDSSTQTGSWDWPRPGNDPETGAPLALSGEIEAYSFLRANGYGGVVVMQLGGLNYSYWVIPFGFDTATPAQFDGRYNGSIAFSSFDYSFGRRAGINGAFTLTR